MNSKITFPELIELLATATGTSKRMSELFLKELFATVSQALIDGENVRIKNLGQFKLEPVKSRKSVSVNTGQEVEIPSHNRLVFTPAKGLADALNEPFAHFETVVLSDDITDEQLATLDSDLVPEVQPVQLPQELEELESQLDNDPDDKVLDDSDPDDSTEVLETPPPFIPVKETVEEQPVIEEETPQESEEEAIQEPELEQEQEPEPKQEQESDQELEPEPEQELEPEQEQEPEQVQHLQSSEEPETEYYNSLSIVDFEREKREIARKSTIKGLVCGALGMLVLILVGWGLYCLYHFGEIDSQFTASMVSGTNDTIEQADTIKGEEIPDSATTVAATTPVVTDTCTKTMFLTRIANKHYGNRDFWVYIYEENKDKIANPNHVAPGTVVVIPPAEKYGIDADDPQSVKQARLKASQLYSKFPPSQSTKKINKKK